MDSISAQLTIISILDVLSLSFEDYMKEDITNITNDDKFNFNSFMEIINGEDDISFIISSNE